VEVLLRQQVLWDVPVPLRIFSSEQFIIHIGTQFLKLNGTKSLELISCLELPGIILLISKVRRKVALHYAIMLTERLFHEVLSPTVYTTGAA